MRKPLLILLILISTQILSLDFPNFLLGEDAAKEEFKRGLVYKNQRQYSAAKERFQKAVNLKKDFHVARLELANTYFLLGEWEESLDELEILSSNVKNNLVITSKVETLRLAIAGGSSPKERVFYKTIDGDANRGYRFKNPTDIVFDEDNNSYISAIGSSNIVKFNAEGNPVSNFRGGLTRKIEKPVALGYWNKKIFSADFSADEVQVYSIKGDYLYSIGGKGGERGKFRGPSSITFDHKGFLYVSDSGNNRIQKFTETGEFVLELKTYGKDSLINPAGITFYKDNLYVIDKDNIRIVVFDLDGNIIQKIQKSDWKKLRNIRIIEDQIFVSDEITGVWSYSLDLGDWKPMSKFRDKTGVYRILTRPFSVNLDHSRNLYFLDFARHRVDVFTQKNNLYTNLDLKIESVDTTDFPDIHIYTRVRNRSNQEVIGIDRLGFRIYENDNMTPLFSLAKKEKINQKLSLAIIFENSESLKKGIINIENGMFPFFRSLRKGDSISLYRGGKDSSLLIPNTVSLRDILAKIRDSEPEEKWNFGKASISAIQKLSLEIGPKALVYLVSKESKDESFYQYQRRRVVDYAKAHSIPIYVLSVTDQKPIQESWSDIVEPTNGNYLFLDGEGEERKLYNTIRNHFDYRYILSYKTDINPELINRYIKLVVDVNHRGVKGKDIGGYFVPEEN